MSALDAARAALAAWDVHPYIDAPAGLSWVKVGRRDALQMREALRALVAEHERLTAPPAEDDREALAGEISGVQVGSGYESTTIGITAALEAADAILAWMREQGFRRHEPGPVTDAQANEIQGWCPECRGSGMVMEFGPTDCPNLDLHRALDAARSVTG